MFLWSPRINQLSALLPMNKSASNDERSHRGMHIITAPVSTSASGSSHRARVGSCGPDSPMRIWSKCPDVQQPCNSRRSPVTPKSCPSNTFRANLVPINSNLMPAPSVRARQRCLHTILPTRSLQRRARCTRTSPSLDRSVGTQPLSLAEARSSVAARHSPLEDTLASHGSGTHSPSCLSAPTAQGLRHSWLTPGCLGSSFAADERPRTGSCPTYASGCRAAGPSLGSRAGSRDSDWIATVSRQPRLEPIPLSVPADPLVLAAVGAGTARH